MTKQMNKVYTGIGSRETPDEFLTLLNRAAKFLATKDLVLRSGGAKGADSAFEAGCASVSGEKEIYLPWRYFENNPSNLYTIPDWSYQLAQTTHPNWGNCTQGARKLHARNCMQILGLDGKTKSDFVICWTKQGKGSGGTGQAIRLARSLDIPVYDLGVFSHVTDARDYLLEVLNPIIKE